MILEAAFYAAIATNIGLIITYTYLCVRDWVREMKG